MTKLTRSNIYQDLASVSACIEKGKITEPDVWNIFFISAVWPLTSTFIYFFAYYKVFIRGYSKDTSLIFILSDIRFTLLILMLLASCILVFSCTFKIVMLYHRIDEIVRRKSISLRHLIKMTKLAAFITLILNLISAFLGTRGYDIFLYFSPFIIPLFSLFIFIAAIFDFIRFGLVKFLVEIFSKIMTLSDAR